MVWLMAQSCGTSGIGGAPLGRKTTSCVHQGIVLVCLLLVGTMASDGIVQELEAGDAPINSRECPAGLAYSSQLCAGGRNSVEPGAEWLDSGGEVIQAHGGSILYHNGTYFWYGENKAGPTYQPDHRFPARVDFIGISCYSSQDLLSWENRGLALAHSPDISSDLHPSKVVERPKVLFNSLTHKFVMWMHIDSPSYTSARTGVAVSEYPNGPFQYIGSSQPHDSESRDFTVFKDDDGSAYIMYSSEDNMVLHVSRLCENYTSVAQPYHRMLVNLQREAPAVFKHNGLYFLLSSGCSGWWPNAAEVHVAQALCGPWHSLGNPCKTKDSADKATTFRSQGSFVLPVPDQPGRFVFMADRWNEHQLGHSRYIWLPLEVSFAKGIPIAAQSVQVEEQLKWTSVSIRWLDSWVPLAHSN